MTPVKKLADILQDSLSTVAHFEQHYRNVCVRFVCYRNNLAVHQSNARARHELQSELPLVCRGVGASKVQLIITGTDQHQKGAIELYNETFRLARRSQPHESTIHSGYGLGSPMMPVPMGMSGMSYGGLGAVELNALADKIVADKSLRQEHAKLQAEADEMRLKIKKLEDELAEQIEVNSSRNTIKEYADMLTPFAPSVLSLLGIDKSGGKALPGLGSTEEGTSETQTDDEQTKMVMGLVRQFMKGLSETHRQQLLSLMLRIQQDHNLITRLAHYAQKPHQPQNSAAVKPEQPKHEEQHQQQ